MTLYEILKAKEIGHPDDLFVLLFAKTLNHRKITPSEYFTLNVSMLNIDRLK